MSTWREVEVRAETTASVWLVNVVAGQAVEHGDEVVVLESMKMEVPVVAPVSATVSEVLVAVGDSVRQGAVLLRLTCSS